MSRASYPSQGLQFRIPQLKDIFLARKIVGMYLKPTPLVYSRMLSELFSCEAFVKLENLQPTGAFKVRGGVYYMNRMKDEALKHGGVITASTGNHAQSIAYAGSILGVDVKVVMPENVPKVKIDSVRALGAEVLFHGDYFDEARAYAEKLASERGLLFIHSINEPLLYEGVGTMHLEIIEELPDVDIVINPIGGGSGASSACIVYKTIRSDIKVIGVQAEGAPAFYNSWKAGRIVSNMRVDTEAEGLATANAYELPFQILRGMIDGIILVRDEELFHAVRILFDATKQVAEPSGAASTAAAMKIKDRLREKKVVFLLTGGNVRPELFRQLICC